ncbi:MAG: tRNA (guanosine(46)-N7)-methyltransferase TrmB [Phycisphaerae bacterium]|nr:tRNA (guanosine(46)-N7)-methyltransferase TrmB [Phycisphaerae bacterium]
MADFAQIYGRNAPLHVEIGSGKGAFLLSEARARPECNFLGIEWASKYYLHTVDRIGRWGLTNVRIIRTDVAAFLPECVPDASVAAFHIYFPDPWPKKRHHKRRFVCPENTDQMIRCLQPGGLINIATDHAGYFDQIRSTLDAAIAAGRLQPAEFVRAAAAEPGEYVATNYERKYLKTGKPIFTAAARKPQHPD